MSDQIVRSFKNLDIDVDSILRGQGADPEIIRQRRPRLVILAEQALEEGSQLIDPVALYSIFQVEKIGHDYFSLMGGCVLRGALLTQHLGCAEQIALIVCTLGSRLESRIKDLMQSEPSYAFALDGFGSVAAEALGLAICAELEENALSAGLFTSIPINPGMIGWGVEVGQPQIFSALDTVRIGVELTESAQMNPRKSVSMILGISHSSFSAGRPCDFCSMNEICRYQKHDRPVGK